MEYEHIYDISVRLGAGSIDYPGDTPYVRELISTASSGGGYTLSKLCLSAHAGTHLDAPSHFIFQAKSIDQFAVGDFILPAHVIQVQDPEAIRPHEFEGLVFRPGEALLFKTANSLCGRCRNAVFTDSYVYLSAAAAAVCVQQKAGLVGIDYITIERYGDDDFTVHRLLLQNNILILEGLDLSAVPAGRYTLMCLPLNIKDGEASPVRAALLK